MTYRDAKYRSSVVKSTANNQQMFKMQQNNGAVKRQTWVKKKNTSNNGIYIGQAGHRKTNTNSNLDQFKGNGF